MVALWLTLAVAVAEARSQHNANADFQRFEDEDALQLLQVAATRHSHTPARAAHHERNSSRAGAPYRQPLQNLGDVQYTGEVEVGGQKLQGILDTGSFELLVLSKECAVCGDPTKLFDSAQSHNFREGDEIVQHSFGSGTTMSSRGFDTVRVGPLESKKQAFWQVFDAMMPILEESTFGAIVGVGPPDSASKIEDQEDGAEDVPMVMSSKVPKGRHLQMTGRPASPEVSSVCSQFGVQTFSVCIGQQSGSHGFFVWNDAPPTEQGREFTAVEVAGEIHWAGKMTDVQMGQTAAPNDGGFTLCKDGCAAVIDSGTSLIAAPSSVIQEVEEALVSLREDCSNLGDMPDLVFQLGGETFSLPPDAYIGQIVNHGAPALKDILHMRFRSRHYSCVPLFMNIDVDSQLGPMWILGLPFFRKYYTTFSFDTTVSPVKKFMSMALADDECNPADSSALLARDRSEMRPKKIDLSQLRVPRWAEEAMKHGRVTV